MSEYASLLQTIAGFMRISKVKIIRTPKLVLGRRKIAQLKSGRTRA